MKWAAIVCFVSAPWVCAWTAVLLLPDEVPESTVKAELFCRRGNVDTLVVGDSRVGRIAAGPFASRGWVYFNFGLSGVSPEDMAMALKYAITHGRIRRVVIGASFEGMTEQFPFEFSRFHESDPFAAAEIREFATVEQAGTPLAARREVFLSRDVLPLTRANPRIRLLWAKAAGHDESAVNPDGTVRYSAIRARIEAGTYDFETQRNPRIYFNREDSEVRYLARPELAQHAQRLYRKVLAELRAARIPCVVFETPRTARYQELLDDDIELCRLQRQWREFFRRQCGELVAFLDATETRDCVAEEDFIDAVHFIGPTEERLAARLATKLDILEHATASGRGGAAPPSGKTPGD